MSHYRHRSHNTITSIADCDPLMLFFTGVQGTLKLLQPSSLGAWGCWWRWDTAVVTPRLGIRHFSSWPAVQQPGELVDLSTSFTPREWCSACQYLGKRLRSEVAAPTVWHSGKYKWEKNHKRVLRSCGWYWKSQTTSKSCSWGENPMPTPQINNFPLDGCS